MEPIRYRLGLDLGTNSIGWAVYELDEDCQPLALNNIGVRIFSDGRDPKTKEPLAVERRQARGQRTLIRRRKLRRRRTFLLLKKELGLSGWSPEALAALKALDPYRLRVKALDEPLSPEELLRVLFHLSVRRGFKSNRKAVADGEALPAEAAAASAVEGNDRADADSEPEAAKPAEPKPLEKLSQGERCLQLDALLDGERYRSLGEFLWLNREANHGLRFIPDKMPYYPLRKHYEAEFDAIRHKQEPYFPRLNWEAVRESIFHQLPLRPQERGGCQILKEKERTFKAMPSACRLRILQDVFNLKISDSRKSRPLTDEQRRRLVELLNKKEKVKFSEMKKELNLRDGDSFNLEANEREFLLGNSTEAKWRSPKRFGEGWDRLTLTQKDDLVEICITAQNDDEVREALKAYSLPPENEAALIRWAPPSGTTAYCREITEKAVEKWEARLAAGESQGGRAETVGDDAGFLLSTMIQAAAADFGVAYSWAEQKVDAYDTLPYYGKVLVGSTMGKKKNPKNEEEEYGKIANPTVHVALNQVRTVVNCLIRNYGKPTQIVVELSRELKLSREAKANRQKKQNTQKKKNENINNVLSDGFHLIHPNRNDRLKYRLWQELGINETSRCCPYCGKVIGASELFNPDIEIEHILPFGRTLWDAETNKTLAHHQCNLEKGNRSPYEAFGNRHDHYQYSRILARVAEFPKNKKACFAEDAMERFEKDSSFISRQLTDNAYLSKAALRYLKSICPNPKEKEGSPNPNVWAVNGQMTALLRQKWRLDELLRKPLTENEIRERGLQGKEVGDYIKNRYDHRHHAVDASVIGLVDRALVQHLATENAKGSFSNRIRAPWSPLLADLSKHLQRVVVSFKPDHGIEGKLSKETYLGKIKQAVLTPIEQLKTKEDFERIRNPEAKEACLAALNEAGGKVKAAVARLQPTYPSLWILNDTFVSRSPLTSIDKEEKIKDIVDPLIRQRLHDFIRLHSSLPFKDAVLQFGRETGIRRVRCVNFVQTPIEITGGPIPRYLAPEDYLCVTVWEVPPKREGGKPSFEGVFYRRDELKKDRATGKVVPKTIRRPHDAAKAVCTLFKNDILELYQPLPAAESRLPEEGQWVYARIAGVAATSNKLDVRPIYAVTDCRDWSIATPPAMRDASWGEQKGQNYKSINILFGNYRARKVTVNPIGMVFRRG